MGKKCKLSELCDVRDGTHDSPEYVQEGYPLVTSKNIVDGRLDLTVVNYISEKDYNHINERSKVDLGDIIMPMIGTIGNPHLIEAIPEFAIKNVALIKFPKSDVSNKFIYYFLQSDAFNTYVAENNRGGTQKFLSLKDIRNMDIPALPYEKQLEICLVLDKVSELIGLRKEQHAKLDQLVKSRFVELFGDIHAPSKWEKKPWSELVTIQNGRDYKNILVESGGYPVYGTGGEMARASEYLCPENTIIVGRKGTINNPLLVKEKFWNVDTAFGVIVGNQLNYQYFYNFCRMFDFSTLNKQAVLPSTTKADLLKIEIAVPPMELQNQFAAFVEQTDKSKLAIQQSLDKLELLKKSLMQQYFG